MKLQLNIYNGKGINMKRAKLIVLLAVVLLIMVSGCDNTGKTQETPAPTSTPANTAEATQKPEETPDTTEPPTQEETKVCGYDVIPQGDVELFEDRIEMYIDERTFYSTVFLLLDQPDNFVISYRLTCIPDTNYMQAGLYITLGGDIWGKFMRCYADGSKVEFYGTKDQLWDFEEGASGSMEDPFASSESIYMKMEAKDNMLGFYLSDDGENWQLLGTCIRLFDEEFEIGFSGATFASGVSFEAVFDQLKIEYIE
jgi:regulation of enolase protein 1 (concanavalin A-like superfamily)